MSDLITLARAARTANEAVARNEGKCAFLVASKRDTHAFTTFASLLGRLRGKAVAANNAFAAAARGRPVAEIVAAFDAA